MEATYEFTAYNSEKFYGYGTREEAEIYLRWLNRNREINLYGMSKSNLTEDQADHLAISLQENIADLDLAD